MGVIRQSPDVQAGISIGGNEKESDTKERDKNLEEKIADFRMFDDTFMSAVFDGKTEETEFLIRVILGRDDILVRESKAQFFMSNIYGRGVRLDILASDPNGNSYHFEVERSKGRASVQRARFTGAMVDSRLLRKGQDLKRYLKDILSLLRKRISSEQDYHYIMRKTRLRNWTINRWVMAVI